MSSLLLLEDIPRIQEAATAAQLRGGPEVFAIQLVHQVGIPEHFTHAPLHREYLLVDQRDCTYTYNPILSIRVPKSLILLTPPQINIWSHIFGWFLFLALGWADYTFLRDYGSTQDKVVAAILIVCFQVCMVMSSVYHTFSCRSEKDYDCFLSLDLFGIALSLIAIYISGIYYAFWCQDVSEDEEE